MARNIRNADCIGDLTSEDILDSRDLAKLLDDLEGGGSADDEDEDRAELLKALTELRDECEGSGWRDGIAFINESYWQDYCEQFAEDVGYVSDDDRNPLASCVDWGKWADLMAEDYQTTEIGGTTFYWREA